MAGWGRSGRIIIEFDPPPTHRKNNGFILDPTLKSPKNRVCYISCFIVLYFLFVVKSY